MSKYCDYSGRLTSFVCWIVGMIILAVFFIMSNMYWLNLVSSIGYAFVCILDIFEGV